MPTFECTPHLLIEHGWSGKVLNRSSNCISRQQNRLRGRRSRASTVGAPVSTKTYAGSIDRDHQHIQDRPPIGSAGIGTTSRKPDAGRLDVLRCQPNGCEAAGYVDGVVVAAQRQVLAEEEDLSQTVRLDRSWKLRAQDAPHLRTLGLRLDLVHSDAFHSE
jgi:hypothetical protein